MQDDCTTASTSAAYNATECADDHDDACFSFDNNADRTSTPLHFMSGISGVSSSLQSTADPVTLKKISDMEEELALLRQQIAALVVAQEEAARAEIGKVLMKLVPNKDFGQSTS